MKCFNGYNIKIIYDGSDWLASVPTFPSVLAYGETPEDALDQLRVEFEGYCVASKRKGIEIPERDEEE